MKLLCITSAYWPAVEAGGVVSYLHKLNQELLKQDVEVSVYANNITLENDRSIELGQEMDLDGVRVCYFDYLGPKNYLFSPSLRSRLLETMGRYDLVHIHSIWTYAGYIASRIAADHNVPQLLTLYGKLNANVFKKNYLKKIFYLKYFVNKMLKAAKAVQFVSAEEYDQTKRLMPHGLKVYHISNGIETARLSAAQVGIDIKKKHKLPAQSKLILFLGRINWVKGLDLLLESFRRLAAENPMAQLILAGPDNEGFGSKIRQLVAEAGLADKVIFAGMVSDEEKTALLLQSDLMVLSSLSDAMPVSVLEAMAAGLPVLVTDNIGISEELSRNSAGIVVKRNADDVYLGMADALKNERKCLELANNARKLVRSQYDISRTGEQIMGAYRQITKK
jgi:glycosyltransferase involved in cell wall biosynthesis